MNATIVISIRGKKELKTFNTILFLLKINDILLFGIRILNKQNKTGHATTFFLSFPLSLDPWAYIQTP